MSITTSTGFKKMNWMPKKSAWQEMQLAKQKREQSNARIARMNAASSGFQAAQTMQIQGIGDLATQSAQSRMENQVKQMRAKLEERMAGLSKLV